MKQLRYCATLTGRQPPIIRSEGYLSGPILWLTWHGMVRLEVCPCIFFICFFICLINKKKKQLRYIIVGKELSTFGAEAARSNGIASQKGTQIILMKDMPQNWHRTPLKRRSQISLGTPLKVEVWNALSFQGHSSDSAALLSTNHYLYGTIIQLLAVLAAALLTPALVQKILHTFTAFLEYLTLFGSYLSNLLL